MSADTRRPGTPEAKSWQWPWLLLTGLLVVAIPLLAGCEPQVRPEELGHIIYDRTQLPGADDGKGRSTSGEQAPSGGEHAAEPAAGAAKQ